jgi:serine/threonine protein kinase
MKRYFIWIFTLCLLCFALWGIFQVRASSASTYEWVGYGSIYLKYYLVLQVIILLAFILFILLLVEFRRKKETLHYVLKKRQQAFTIDESIPMLMPVFTLLYSFHLEGKTHLGVSPRDIHVNHIGVASLYEPSKKRFVKPTPYQSPEQGMVGGRVGPWSDVYALGALLFTMTTLKIPDLAEQRLIKDTLPEQLLSCPELSEEFRSVLLRTMALKIEDRIPDVGSLILKLDFMHEFNNTARLLFGSEEMDEAARDVLMRAMTLKSISQIGNVGSFLPELGMTEMRMPVTLLDRPPRLKTRATSAMRAAMIVLLCLYLLLGASLCVWIVGMKNYDRLDSYVQAEQYTQALDARSGIYPFYRDTQQLNVYLNAWLTMESGKYDEAKAVFDTMLKYRHAMTLSRECDYRKACALFRQGRYIDAKAIFVELKGYLDSEAMIEKCDEYTSK